MAQYFVTGYNIDDILAEARVTPAPQDPSERLKQLDAIHYSPQGQDRGLLAFAVAADDEADALKKGHEAHALWVVDALPEIR